MGSKEPQPAPPGPKPQPNDGACDNSIITTPDLEQCFFNAGRLLAFSTMPVCPGPDRRWIQEASNQLVLLAAIYSRDHSP